MKNVKLNALAAACLGAVASTSVMAFEPQDFGTSTIVGEHDFYVHQILNYNNTECGALCVQFSTESGHNFTHHRVPDSVPGASETLNCSVTDASGNLLSGVVGDTPETILSYSFNDDFGGVPGNDVTSDGVNGPAFPAFGNVLVHDVCELDTDDLGKIVGGYTQNFAELTALPGTFLHTIYDYEFRIFYVMQCGTGVVPTIAQARAIDRSNAVPPAGCSSIDSIFDMNYHTCDTRQACGSGGKAVPVPAFAAAALGLGLIGVTYLTSARRRVKS